MILLLPNKPSLQSVKHQSHRKNGLSPYQRGGNSLNLCKLFGTEINLQKMKRKQRKKLELFYYIPRGIPKKDMIKMIEDAGIKADADLIRRVHSKVKGAAADYLNYSS